MFCTEKLEFGCAVSFIDSTSERVSSCSLWCSFWSWVLVSLKTTLYDVGVVFFCVGLRVIPVSASGVARSIG